MLSLMPTYKELALPTRHEIPTKHFSSKLVLRPSHFAKVIFAQTSESCIHHLTLLLQCNQRKLKNIFTIWMNSYLNILTTIGELSLFSKVLHYFQYIAFRYIIVITRPLPVFPKSSNLTKLLKHVHKQDQ